MTWSSLASSANRNLALVLTAVGGLSSTIYFLDDIADNQAHAGEAIAVLVKADAAQDVRIDGVETAVADLIIILKADAAERKHESDVEAASEKAYRETMNRLCKREAFRVANGAECALVGAYRER